MKLLVRIVILIVVVSMFNVRCANRGTPEGGPIDSLPPVVIRTTPAPYTTNFKDKVIFIEFDEYVQLKDQQKLFFVSPPGETKPLLTIKKRGIEVKFEDDLDSATTYRLDFGTSIVDNNESNPLGGYSFVFSTGDYIDSLVMAGQVLSAYERDSVFNAFIFFFDEEADSTAIDSTIFNARADALFRTDSLGYFVADILKDKNYRVYAMEDNNGDQKYQAGTDRIAFTDLVFNPTELDDFSVTFDTSGKILHIDPLQVSFDMFKEIPIRRQMIMSQERPLRQKILMTFNSPYPEIDSIELEGIDPNWIIMEDGMLGDSVILWVAPPTIEDVDALQDSIKGSLVLMKEDSVWNRYREREKLAFVHKIHKTEEQLKAERREAKEAAKSVKNGEVDSTDSSEKKLSKKEKKELKRREKEKGQDNKTEVIDSLSIEGENTMPADIDSAASIDKSDPSMINGTNGEKKSEDPGKDADEEQTAEGEEIKEEEKKKLSFKVVADANALNPDTHIKFEFDYPLRKLDTSLITLKHFKKTEIRGRTTEVKTTELDAKFTIEQSKEFLRHWTLRADWREGDEYLLTINAGAIEDITFTQNDSLSSKFTVAHEDKFGQLTFTPTAYESDTSYYIYELVQGMGSNQKLVHRIKDVKPGTPVVFSYLKEGTYMLRIIQDRNRNGKWDTGSLTERRQPEKVRMLVNNRGKAKEFVSRERWKVNEKIDLITIFEQ